MIGRFFAVLALAGLLFLPTASSAQDVAVGQVTATVQTVLAVTATQALVFDAVQQGVPTAVGVDDIAAPTLTGIFSISGANSSEVSAYFQLPDYLWNENAGDEDRLVISFGTTDAVIDEDPALATPSAPGAGTAVNPHALGEFNLDAVGGQAAIYLGGTVWPTVDQRALNYSADIVLTVAYTGN
ncbi:MAG: hypothetical protein KAU36_04285 [candidate division Zixibacteria bacterium]|nr:hypothetical protein [candidate division Zixibacteria bacterium]